VRFTKDDLERVASTLRAFLVNAAAHAILLSDSDGHILLKEGAASTYDEASISAVVAESFQSNRRLADLLGENGFSTLFHQGHRENLHLTLVGKRYVLAVVFNNSTNLLMIRLYADQVVAKLTEFIEHVRGRGPS